MARARFACALALVSAIGAFACVDGKTPDCSTPSSGCFAGESDASAADASDASSDVSVATDAKDAEPVPGDAGDASDVGVAD